MRGHLRGSGATGWHNFAPQELDEEEVGSLNWELAKRVYPIGHPYRWRIGVILFCITFTTGLSMLPPFIIRMIIDDVFFFFFSFFLILFIFIYFYF